MAYFGICRFLLPTTKTNNNASSIAKTEGDLNEKRQEDMFYAMRFLIAGIPSNSRYKNISGQS